MTAEQWTRCYPLDHRSIKKPSLSSAWAPLKELHTWSVLFSITASKLLYHVSTCRVKTNQRRYSAQLLLKYATVQKTKVKLPSLFQKKKITPPKKHQLSNKWATQNMTFRDSNLWHIFLQISWTATYLANSFFRQGF